MTRPFYGLTIVLAAILLLLLGWWNLFAWSVIPIQAQDVWLSLTHFDSQSISHRIVQDLRLPRLLTAMFVGACLATAGTIMQGLTRNPLAAPSVLGINAGAALGMALVSTLPILYGALSTSLAAMIGGGVAWLLVMLLGNSWRIGGNEHGRLVLAGVAISALCAALTKAVVIMEEDQAAGVLTWLTGSLADARWQTWQHYWPFALAGLFGALLLTPSLNLLQLGEEHARNLGANLLRSKLFGSFLVLLLVGTTISAVGSIGFIGLIVPHMARLLVGQDFRIFLPVAMLLGATLVTLADTLSRAISYPMETPAGAILALIGAPFFIYLVRKRTL
ncbi:iron chelate uptake ABC transporter family permease subunit [Marinomonas communis]|uniref:Iron complex transport system permease protein n=1 Tax=Marinomonas communis TaxID=28254 RepID=A0A4R6X2R3_9GAMM|nr:iron chelate uptake ABC transporter family permease subunit [Marinomonas communis]TDR13172.1 iron complex transport system permease protein [Marinomonas communis]